MRMIWLSRVVLGDEAGVIRHALVGQAQLECLIVDFDMHFQLQADVVGVILAQAQDGAQRLFHRRAHACLRRLGKLVLLGLHLQQCVNRGQCIGVGWQHQTNSCG